MMGFITIDVEGMLDRCMLVEHGIKESSESCIHGRSIVVLLNFD